MPGAYAQQNTWDAVQPAKTTTSATMSPACAAQPSPADTSLSSDTA